MRPPMLAVVLAVLNLGLTCGLSVGKASQTPVLNATLEEVMAELRAIVRRENFSIEEVDLERGWLDTVWKVQPSPHWREGRRERFRIDAWQVEGGVVVSIAVIRNVNDNSSNPGSTGDAIWIPAAKNEALQDRIVMLLKMKFTDWSMDQ